MSAESTYFRVGAFVLGGLALAAATTVVVAGTQVFDRPIVLETYFPESVQGLEVGSPVKLRGVKLGTVKEINFVRDEYPLQAPGETEKYEGLVLVRMEITEGGADVDRATRLRNVREMIERGLRLKLTPLGITGTSFIQGDFLDAARYPPMTIAWKPKYLYVPSAPSTITEISSAAERLMSRIDKLNVEDILAHLDTLLVTMNETVAKADVGGVQKSLSAVLDDLRRTSAEVRAVVSRSDVASTSADARATLREVTAILVRLQELLAGGGDDLGSTLDNLRVASENLREASETARAYPSLLLFGGPPPAPDGKAP